jgi:digeranylgeranylglycerophospholipid reductase
LRNQLVRDVVVIGAGPAGLTAARELARRGRDVVVLEEHHQIGQPVHCTGLVGLGAFEELDLPREPILSVAGAAAFRAGDAPPLVVASERVRAAIVDRGAFDAALARQAAAAGAEVRVGCRVTRIDRSDEGVLAHLEGGPPLAARACILACGAQYRFNRAFGLGVPRVFVQTAQVQIPFPPLDHIEVRFGRDLAPGGFAWIVPFRREGGSYARIGLMATDRVRARFDRYLAELAGEVALDRRDVPPPRLKMLPLGPVARTYAARVLAVGDAAGLVKPTTGGGIYYSVLSGQLAAQTLDEALAAERVDDTGLSRYEERWRVRLGPEIRIGLAFRAIASRLSDRAIRTLLDLARSDGLVPLVTEAADFNWHRRAALALLRNPAFRRVVFESWWG